MNHPILDPKYQVFRDWSAMNLNTRKNLTTCGIKIEFTWKFGLTWDRFEWFLDVDHRNTFWAAQLNSFGISFRQRHTKIVLFSISGELPVYFRLTHQKRIYNSVQPGKTICNILHVCAPKACQLYIILKTHQKLTVLYWCGRSRPEHPWFVILPRTKAMW